MITAPMTAYTPVSYPMMPAMNPQQGAIQQQQPQAQMPGAIYNYPTASCYTQPQTAKSQFNGVNIEIINPTGNTAAMPTPAPAYYSQPVYPAAVPAMNIPYQFPASQAIVQAPQVATPVETPAAAPVVTPAVTQQVSPVVTPQVAAPAVQTVPVQAPQTQAATPVVPAPQIETPAAAAPVAADPTINPATFAGKLQTTNLDAQKAAIEEIAELVKNDNTAGPILLDTQIFDALVGIINTDTSALAGPTPEINELRNKPADQLTAEQKQLAETPTQLEKAEMNKQYALYTIAFMQERLNNELEQRNGQALELKDLPEIETVINTLKSNPNPNLRAGAIAALSHIAKPQYSADLKTIFELAQQDENADVKAKAEKAAQALK